MAVLQKIRGNLIAQLAIGLGMVGFIATGLVTFFNDGRHNMPTVVRSVNGTELEINDFNNEVEEYENVMRIMRQYPMDYRFNSDEEAQIREQVWQSSLQKQLLKDECDKLGLTVTNNELANIIKEGKSPLLTQLPFFVTPNRTFDYPALQQFLKQYSEVMGNAQIPADQKMQMEVIHSAWMFIEKEIRASVLAQKYQSLLCSLILSNPVSAKAGFEGRTQETDIVMAGLPYTTVTDSEITIEDSDLKAKLSEYSDAFYSLRETRDIKYIDVVIEPSLEDKANLNNQMDSYAQALQAENANIDSIVRVSNSLVAYTSVPMSKNTIRNIDANIAGRLDSMAVGTQTSPYLNVADNTMNIVRLLNRVSRPDSVEVRQLAVVNADAAAAKVSADSILTALRSGVEFDSIAKRYDQPGTKTWITANQYEGQMMDDTNREFITTVNTTAVGEYKTVTADGGIIILQVTDRRAINDKYDVVIIKRSIDFSNETAKQYMEKLATFVNNCANAEELEKNSTKENYMLISQPGLACNDYSLPNVAGTREIVRWAFNEDTEVGTILDPKAYGNNSDHLVVAVLTAIHPAGNVGLDNENAKQALTELVKQDKKAAKLQEQMKAAKSVAEIAKIKGAISDTIQHITFSAPAYIQSMGGAPEPALSGAASAVAEGKFVQGVRGNAGVYAFQVLKKNNTAEKFDEKSEMQRAAMQNASMVYQMFQMNVENPRSIFFNSLKEGKYTDNRNLFF